MMTIASVGNGMLKLFAAILEAGTRVLL